FPDMSVTSFNWGPWEGGMVSPALKAAFRARGIKTLDTKMGANLFADVMMSDLNATEVCIGEI
ncbi:MAG: polyketide synthase, partial [Pseudomonadota bacterium]